MLLNSSIYPFNVEKKSNLCFSNNKISLLLTTFFISYVNEINKTFSVNLSRHGVGCVQPPPPIGKHLEERAASSPIFSKGEGVTVHRPDKDTSPAMEAQVYHADGLAVHSEGRLCILKARLIILLSDVLCIQTVL